MAKKHDDVFTIITRKVEKFVASYIKTILIFLAVAVVLLGSYFYVHYLMTKKEGVAESSFGKVYLVYRSIVDDKSADADTVTKKLLDLNKKFQVVIDEHPNSIAASKSAYFMGNIYYRAQEYTTALERFQKGSEIKTGSYSAMLCLLGVARSYEQMSEFKKAEETYRNIIDRYEKAFIIPSVHYSLAEIYEQLDDRESAEKEYSKIVSDYNWSSWSDLAKKKLLFLKSTG